MKRLTRLLALGILAGAAFAQPALHLKAQKRDRRGTAALSDSPQKTRTPGRSHLMVQFADSPSDDQLTGLQNRGAVLLSYIPDFALSVSAGDDTSFDGLNLQWVDRLYPDEKISPELVGTLGGGGEVPVLVEFYTDVDPSDARAIANDAGLVIHENPDLQANHLLVSGNAGQLLDLAGWDEVAYIFPVSAELVQGTPVRGCVGAMTSLGRVTQAIPLVGDGWDGPGRGGADLKYAFVHMTEKLPADSAKAEIVRAFSEWAKYAKLTFTLSDDARANRTIAVLFASGYHGDAYPFAGPGGVLAHTFYPFPVNAEPIAGDVHFNNDESWRIGTDIDVFSIALHETGHALGLGHSDKPGDVMYPYYRRVTGLTADDIAAVLQLYAAQTEAPAAGPLTLTVQVPASPVTAASISLNGSASGGKGNVQVSWSTNHGASGVAQGAPNWSIAAIPLSVGDNVITITARDSQQSQVARTVIVTRQQPSPSGPDTTPPSLTIVSPSASTLFTSDSSIVVTGTAHDNVGIASVTWTGSTGGSGMASGTNNWSTPAIPLYVGTTTITIRASDAAGNTSWRSVTVTRR